MNYIACTWGKYLCDCMVDTSHGMKSGRMHVTASYITSKLMEGCSRRRVLQSSIIRLVYMHGSLIALIEHWHGKCYVRFVFWKCHISWRWRVMWKCNVLGNTTFRGNATKVFPWRNSASYTWNTAWCHAWICM